MPRQRLYASEAEAHLVRYANTHFRARYMLTNAKARAKLKGLDLSVTREWIKERLDAGHCEVTGLPFDTEVKLRGSGRMSPWSPSLDRIDSSKGYTPDNCRLVVWMFNAAKHVGSDADVMKLAEALCKPN